MKISIQALELVLSPEELKKRIPKEDLEKLQGTKGVLQAYTLAYEGTSQPKVLGQGSQSLKWPRAVIRRLAEKIQAGTKFFVGHGDDTNSHDGRVSVGEVLTSFVKEIRGKLSSIVIGHFPEKDKVDPYDICSMEADIHTDEDNVVGDINEVSGIALGDSDKDSPAFPGSLRLSTVQCFGKENSGGDPDMAPLTFAQVKQLVKDMNIWPHQLFEKSDFEKDRTFGPLFEENSTLKADNERLSKEFKEIETTSKDVIRKTEVSESRGNLETLMKEGFTDKQKKFILKRFDPETQKDLSDKGLGEFVEAGKKDFAETAKLFGVEDNSNGNKRPKPPEEENDMETEALKLMGAVD